MAVRQAVHRAPHYPESHNINSLVYEVKSDFQSAITFYQQARFALCILSNSNPENRNDFTEVQKLQKQLIRKTEILPF